MQTYAVFFQTSKVIAAKYGGKSMTESFQNYKRYTFKAQNINNLRARMIKELFKGDSGFCKIFKADPDGTSDAIRHLGDITHYGDGRYVWNPHTEGNFSIGSNIDPKTGRI